MEAQDVDVYGGDGDDGDVLRSDGDDEPPPVPLLLALLQVSAAPLQLRPFVEPCVLPAVRPLPLHRDVIRWIVRAISYPRANDGGNGS